MFPEFLLKVLLPHLSLQPFGFRKGGCDVVCEVRPRCTRFTAGRIHSVTPPPAGGSGGVPLSMAPRLLRGGGCRARASCPPCVLSVFPAWLPLWSLTSGLCSFPRTCWNVHVLCLFFGIHCICDSEDISFLCREASCTLYLPILPGPVSFFLSIRSVR